MAAEAKTIGPRPKRTEANNWVTTKGAKEPMLRLTVDVPAELHGRIKAACAVEHRKMADVLREILELRFGAEP